MAKSGSGGLAGWIKNSRESRSSWYAHYQQKVAYPLFLMGALFLFASDSILAETNTGRRAVRALDHCLTWVVFAVDYLIGLVLAPNRLTFIRGHHPAGCRAAVSAAKAPAAGSHLRGDAKHGGRRVTGCALTCSM